MFFSLIFTKTNTLRNRNFKTEELTQRLKAFVVLIEDLGLVVNSHLVVNSCLLL